MLSRLAVYFDTSFQLVLHLSLDRLVFESVDQAGNWLGNGPRCFEVVHFYRTADAVSRAHRRRPVVQDALGQPGFLDRMIGLLCSSFRRRF